MRLASSENARRAACPARPAPDPKNPRFWPAKKSPLPPAKNPLFCTFRGEKWAFLTNLCTKMHIFDTLFADIAPGLWAASPSGKNPPIYTVLNAAFSAPGPPRLWHRGGTPVPDALTRAPVRPIDIFDEIEKSINYFWSRISPTTLICVIIMKYFYFVIIINKFSILANRSVTPLHFVSTKSSSHTKRLKALWFY
jgi:hypothetical protein